MYLLRQGALGILGLRPQVLPTPAWLRFKNVGCEESRSIFTFRSSTPRPVRALAHGHVVGEASLFWVGWHGDEMMVQPLWQEVKALCPAGPFGLPAGRPSPLTTHLCLVRSTPHLPASPVFHLVWEPSWLAWKHHHLEALRRLSDLPHHALPLHRLLAGAQVPGTKNKMSDTLLCVLEVYRWPRGQGQAL